jgi:hypothetical protein
VDGVLDAPGVYVDRLGVVVVGVRAPCSPQPAMYGIASPAKSSPAEEHAM